jgi:hypothetical protein
MQARSRIVFGLCQPRGQAVAVLALNAKRAPLGLLRASNLSCFLGVAPHAGYVPGEHSLLPFLTLMVPETDAISFAIGVAVALFLIGLAWRVLK